MSDRAPHELEQRAQALAARALRSRSARSEARDPTAPARLGDEEAPTAPPAAPDRPPGGDRTPQAAPGPEIEPQGLIVAPDGSRWALRCHCGRHPNFAHAARPLPAPPKGSENSEDSVSTRLTAPA